MSTSQDAGSLAATASLVDLEAILKERQESGEQPVTWEKVKERLAL